MNTINIITSAAYTPAEAENGKFAVIDSNYLSSLGYPVSTGAGRYAIFTHQLNPVESVLSTTIPLICSSSLLPGASAVFSFDPVVTKIEIYNNSIGNIYFQYTDDGIFDDVISRGMIIPGNEYYTIEKNTDNITFATVSGADVRIFAHRNR